MLAGSPACAAPPIENPRLAHDFLQYHGIEPVMAATCERAAGHDWLDPNQDIAKRAAAAELARGTEFIRVITALQAIPGCAPILFKGQALAHNTYPQPWLRPRTDIDALVERNAFEATVDALTALGYEPADAIDADLVLPQLSLHKHQHGVNHVWDVHWRLSNRPALADALTYSEIRARAVETRVDGIAFLTPDRVHSLLIACMHLMGHHADEVRLIWLYDIHLLVAALSDSEYQRFLDEAAGPAAMQAACHGALALTQRYIPGERTDALCQALDPGPGARWKTNRFYLSGLLADAGAVGRGNRLRFAAQHLFPSKDYMIKRFGIRHRWQLPFWYAIRIVRALPKLFRRR